MTRVAVSGVSGDAGQGAIKGLSQGTPQPWILGMDYSDDCNGFHMVDQAQPMPPVSDAGYVDALIAALTT